MTVVLDILPLLATIFLTICYLPQLIKTYKTKDVSSMSLPFWIMLNIALSLLLANSVILAFLYGSWGYMVSYIFNEGLAFLMLLMVVKYRKK